MSTDTDIEAIRNMYAFLNPGAPYTALEKADPWVQEIGKLYVTEQEQHTREALKTFLFLQDRFRREPTKVRAVCLDIAHMRLEFENREMKFLEDRYGITRDEIGGKNISRKDHADSGLSGSGELTPGDGRADQNIRGNSTGSTAR